MDVPVLNLAAAGDEVRDMRGVAQRQRLIDCLRAGCPAGTQWDALLYSGGGNDIVADPKALRAIRVRARLCVGLGKRLHTAAAHLRQRFERCPLHRRFLRHAIELLAAGLAPDRVNRRVRRIGDIADAFLRKGVEHRQM
jgi:hypothetical protein